MTRIRAAAAVFLSVIGWGCGGRDSATAPSTPVARRAPTQQGERLVLPNPTTVNVLQRNAPIAQATTSATIGPFGGTLSIPSAGLTVVVPPFAVSAPLTITITAVAGTQVAYEFGPSGTKFLVPLIATQNLVGTAAYNGTVNPTALFSGYFKALSDLNPLAGTASITELLGAGVSATGQSLTFPIPHFSGWVIASNRSDDDPDQ